MTTACKQQIPAFMLSAAVMLMPACASIGKIENQPLAHIPEGPHGYSLEKHAQGYERGETELVLAFSGGGTRAAALSYGVLKELRDTTVHSKGQNQRMLDEVDRISSVSGGSFTAAYYGLFGDRIFEDYEQVFLKKDVQADLKDLILSFTGFIGRTIKATSRTEEAVRYYDQHIFHGKTFADLEKSKGPLILINASDLNSRSQFVFIQPQFDALCSDLSTFKVARAVAASSAVPILFDPILLQSRSDCHVSKSAWLQEAEERARRTDDKRLEEYVESMNYYVEHPERPYVTLVDGGVTDNLGVRTLHRVAQLKGASRLGYSKLNRNKSVKRFVIIVVNASTSTPTDIGKSRKLPSIGNSFNALTDMQLHLYNTETNELLKSELKKWAQLVSPPGRTIVPYYIELDFTSLTDPAEITFFNSIPTSFSLETEQVDRLIELAGRLMRDHPEYQKLLKDMGARKN